MESTTIIIIQSFACFHTLSLAVYFGIGKLHLQRKINAIKKITEDFGKEQQSPTKKSDDQFYSLLEPVLQHAGYTFRILSEGQFLVHSGDIHFTINHRQESLDAVYKRIWLENRFKDVRAEELFPESILLITNWLSGIYPEFNVVCSNDGRVRIRYCCDIEKAQDILPHIVYASDLFGKIQIEAKQAISEAYDSLLIKKLQNKINDGNYYSNFYNYEKISFPRSSVLQHSLQRRGERTHVVQLPTRY